MVSTSFKESNEILTWPPIFWPKRINIQNYIDVIEKLDVFRMYFNSIYVAIVTTAGQIFFSSVSAFSFSKLRFKGREALFTAFIATMMVPTMVTLIPRYIIMTRLAWVNTLLSVITPVLLGTPFAVFLMRQFFMTLPNQLMEASIIDGAGYPRILFQVYLPLTKPIMSTLGIFCFMGSWNDFLWPLITLQSHELKTLPIGLASFQGLYGVQYNLLMAGAVLSVIPVLVAFLFAQKQFVEGIAITGLKG
jgi:ABC-type glycerol-3-phosphate transport system permease component